MPDERVAMDEVGRYWDAVAGGDRGTELGLDPALARTIHRVHALAASPSAGARERVWQAVLANAEAAHARDEGSALRVLVPNGRAEEAPAGGIPRDAPSGRQRWFLTQLATAALILLTLIGSFVVFGPGRVSRREAPPVFIPAIEATPATPEAEEAPAAEFLWHADGSPDLEFREPNHPVIGPDGNIWLPDGWNNRIAIFAPDGTWLEDWGTEGSGDGEFLFENGGIGFGGVAFDEDGNIYVADSGNHRVQKFAPDRAFLSAWGSVGDWDGRFRQPVALAVDERGRVYVSDRSGSIEVFDGDGRWIASWDGLGAPVGITIDLDGNVWVADEGKTEVIKFSPDGERLLTWNAFGLDAGEFSQPSGVDVDAEGRLFVSDRNNRVQIFSSDGDYLGSWGSFGLDPGMINGPYGIAVGEDGVAYTGEDVGRRLQAFRLLPPFGPEAPIAESAAATPVVLATPAAAPLAVAEIVWETRGGPGMPFDGPYKPAIDPAGNLWIPDGHNHRFQIFSPDGDFLEVWGAEGTGDGQFDFDLGESGLGTVVWDEDGNFYVADTGNHRIQKFAPDRSFLAAWGSEGDGAGQFYRLIDLALDREGRLYATDASRDVVQVFDRDGVLLDSWGGIGTDAGQLMGPTGIAFDREGNVYISEYAGNRIQKLSPSGEPLAMWGSFGRKEGQFVGPEDVILDAQGRVLVIEWSNQRVQVFDANGQFLAAWGGLTPDGDDVFDHPTGAALDEEGFIYVSDEGSDAVYKLRLLPPREPAAAAIGSAAMPGAAASPMAAGSAPAEFMWETTGGPETSFDDPTALAIAPDGKLWVPDGNNGRFQIFTLDGEFVETWGTPGSGEGEFNFAFGDSAYGAVAWDGDGNIYVADTGNFRIQKFAPDRSFLLSWGVRGDGDGQFQAVTNLVVDGESRIYAIDAERHVIQIFDQEGAFLEAWGNQGIGDGEFLKPGGAAFDADGNLYVSDSMNYRVQVFAPDGSAHGAWRSNGTGDGAIVSPTDVAVDAQGQVYVAGSGNHRVQIFDADGSYLASWGGLGSGEGQFANPTFVAVGGDGEVYVSDEGNGRVQKFRLLQPLGPG